MYNVSTYLKYFFDWSEAWAPLIPIFVLLKHRKQPDFMRPVIVYILLAFPINLLGDYIGDFKHHLPENYWFQKNVYLYNIHSLVRFVCFAYFFIGLKQPYYTKLKKVIAFIYLAALFIDLTWYEDFFDKSSIGAHLFTVEAFLLLVYCLLYYLSKLKNDSDELMSGADIYVVTGLSIFVVINFFVFLFYDAILVDDWEVADKMWSIHNISYIILCLLIAKAFASAKKFNTVASQ